jgi:hypothetical protein
MRHTNELTTTTAFWRCESHSPCIARGRKHEGLPGAAARSAPPRRTGGPGAGLTPGLTAAAAGWQTGLRRRRLLHTMSEMGLLCMTTVGLWFELAESGGRYQPTIGVMLQSSMMQLSCQCNERAVCSSGSCAHHQWQAQRAGARPQHTGCQARGAVHRWPPPRPQRLSTRQWAAKAGPRSIASVAGTAVCDLQMFMWSEHWCLLQVGRLSRQSVSLNRAATCSCGATSTPTRQRVMRSVCFASLTTMAISVSCMQRHF